MYVPKAELKQIFKLRSAKIFRQFRAGMKFWMTQVPGGIIFDNLQQGKMFAKFAQRPDYGFFKIWPGTFTTLIDVVF